MPSKKQASEPVEENQNSAPQNEHEKKFSEMIDQAEAKLKETLDDLTKKAEEVKGVAEYALKDKLEETEKQIKANPLSAVAIAAGIGFVIGLLLNRRG